MLCVAKNADRSLWTQKPQKQIVQLIREEKIWSFAIRNKNIAINPTISGRYRGVKYFMWVLLEDVRGDQGTLWAAFTYGSLFAAPDFPEEFAPVGSLEVGYRLWAGSFF